MRHPPPLEPVLEEDTKSSSGNGSGRSGKSSSTSTSRNEYYSYSYLPPPLPDSVIKDERRKEMWKRKLDQSPEGKRRREKRAEERLTRLMTMTGCR